MAVRIPTDVKTDNGMWVVTWLSLEENGGVKDSGRAVSPPAMLDLWATATGNFDTSATIQMQGSNDLTNWFSIGAGTLAVATPARQITERPRYIRPLVAADGAADASAIDVILSGRMSR